MRHQVRRWWRSQRLFVVVAMFVFSGLTAPLLAAHLADILASLDDSQGISVVAADPTWDGLLRAYFKNASQLVLLVVCYVVGSTVALGADPARRIHYVTRVTRRGQLLRPRLAVAVAVTGLGVLCGAAVALYETAALADGTDVRRALVALGLQGGAMVAFVAVAGALAFASNSPFASTLAVSGSVLVGGLLDGVSTVREWSPTTLLNPAGLLSPDARVDELWKPGAVLLAIVLVTLLLAAFPRTVTPRRAAPHPGRGGHHLDGRPGTAHRPDRNTTDHRPSDRYVNTPAVAAAAHLEGKS